MLLHRIKRAAPRNGLQRNSRCELSAQRWRSPHYDVLSVGLNSRKVGRGIVGVCEGRLPTEAAAAPSANAAVENCAVEQQLAIRTRKTLRAPGFRHAG